MTPTLLIHIIGGSLGLITGFTALYTSKGAPLHRRAGTVFVYSMLVMCATGITAAIVRGAAPAINIPAALLTASLIVTAVTTVRPPSALASWLNSSATAIVFAVGLTCVVFMLQAFANGGKRNGMPAFPFMMFGVVALLAGLGDLRIMKSGPLQGARRIARHLWRMSFALFVAAMSFFIGQARVIPKPIRIYPLLALPVLAVLITMFYWLWRVRSPRRLRAVVVTASN